MIKYAILSFVLLIAVASAQVSVDVNRGSGSYRPRPPYSSQVQHIVSFSYESRPGRASVYKVDNKLIVITSDGVAISD
jgi:hypothetical protein